MVKRYDEFMEISRIQEDINKLFDQLMKEPDERSEGSVGAFNPSTDILETEDEVFMRIEVPGVEPGDLSLTLSGNTLTISGVKKAAPHDDKGVTFICMERSYGRFSRSLYVNFPINTHKASAELKAGILVVKEGRCTYLYPLDGASPAQCVCKCGALNTVPSSLRIPGVRQFSPRAD